MNIDAIYIIISKEFEKDRLNYLENYFDKYKINIPIIYFEPFYKNRDEDKIDFQTFNHLSFAEIMLFCSYEKLFETIVIEKKYKYILTLESDVLFCEDFQEKLNLYFREWVENAKHPSILFIGNGVSRGFVLKTQISENLFQMDETRCTDSMLFDYDSIKFLFEKIKFNKGNIKISKAIDRFIDNYIGLDINSYWIKDPIISQGSQNGTYLSNIQPNRIRSKRKKSKHNN